MDQKTNGPANSPRLTVIVLTFNSENTIRFLLDSVLPLKPRMIVVDSFSSDKTQQIAEAFGAEFVQHPFENYSRQRRWSEEYAQVPEGQWMIHLDADEIPSKELIQAIETAVAKNDATISGYLMRRLNYFWGRPMRHGHMNPSWHLRLYRSGQARCEDRLYDQHYITEGKTEKLGGELLDLQLVSLTGWTASHNRWSTAEAEEAFKRKEQFEKGDTLKASLKGDLREKKRWIKENVWYKSPLFVRAYALIFYNYIIKLGFLDGKEGFVYHVLHAFWFRFLVDAKILELREFKDFADGKITGEWLSGQGVSLSGRSTQADAVAPAAQQANAS